MFTRTFEYLRAHRVSDLAMAAMFLIAIGGLSGAAQENAAAPSATKPPAKAQGKHFMVSYASPSTNKKLDDVGKNAPAVLQSVGEGVAEKLVGQGLVRVPALDITCCNLQLTMLSGGPAGEESQTKREPISIRAAVLDINNQPLYTKEFVGTTTGSDAVQGLVLAVVADPKIMTVLKGN